MFDKAIAIFLFLSPIFYFRDYPLSVARAKFFLFGTIALFAISLFSEQRRKFNYPIMGIVLLLAFLRMFFDNGTGVLESYNFWLSSANFMYVLCGVLLFKLVYCYTKNIRGLFDTIITVNILNFILVVAQLLKYDFMWHLTPSVNGFMDTSSQLGQYSTLSIPILFYINPFLAIFPLFTLFVSKSVSCILASALGMAFVGGFKGNILKIKALIGILLIILGLFNFGYISSKFKCRPERWRKTAKIALQRPFLGWGYRTYNDKVMQLNEKDSIGYIENQRPHNDYFHTAQELGFPIVVCFVIFFVGLFKKIKTIKNKDRLFICLATSVLIVLINMFGQTEIRYASIAGTFIVLTALFCIKVEEGAQNA